MFCCLLIVFAYKTWITEDKTPVLGKGKQNNNACIEDVYLIETICNKASFLSIIRPSSYNSFVIRSVSWLVGTISLFLAVLGSADRCIIMLFFCFRLCFVSSWDHRDGVVTTATHFCTSCIYYICTSCILILFTIPPYCLCKFAKLHK